MKIQLLPFWAMVALLTMPQQMRAEGISINETTFPDANFRNWVLAQEYGQDGVLTEAEIAGVTYIHVHKRNITNLKGIEYFTALTQLWCDHNLLTSLNISKNTALTQLWCHSNLLTSLNISKNTALTGLECFDNLLTFLDVSKNRKLNRLDCFNNQLSLLDISQNMALKILDCNNNQLTALDTSQNEALTELYCSDNKLTSLDISKNTSLTNLGCGSNQLTSLDVSKNTALTVLTCYNNQLTSLDVSKNTALTYFDCGYNLLTSLEVSQNIALNFLLCYNNQLTSLDVSKNTALTDFDFRNNLLTSLDVSQNTALCYLVSSCNQINETEMGNIVENLPIVDGGATFYVKQLENDIEQNVITASQVAAARDKGWTVYAFDAEWNEVEYDGDEPTMEPIDNADFGSDIDEMTNLDGNVVGNIYYNISSGNGGYNVVEGCIVVTTPTDDAVVNGQDIFGEDFKDNYTGIVFKVPASKGSIKLEAQTTGNMMIKVKIGNNDPFEMMLQGKTKISIPYNVTEPTYVYIYGGSYSSVPDMMGSSSTSGELKLYSIEVAPDETGIVPIDNGELRIDNYCTLDGQKLNGTPTKKGVYIVNGRKVVIK